MFYFGRPIKDEVTFDDKLPYRFFRSVAAYNKAKAERDFPWGPLEYAYYEIRTNRAVEMASEILYKNIEFYIRSYEAEYINSRIC